MLEIRGLRKTFGSLVAVNDVSFLLGFTAVFGALALSRFRWEEA